MGAASASTAWGSEDTAVMRLSGGCAPWNTERSAWLPAKAPARSRKPANWLAPTPANSPCALQYTVTWPFSAAVPLSAAGETTKRESAAPCAAVGSPAMPGQNPALPWAV
ncbi:hypothetical protein ABH941_000404 [Streptacidiphilus sp. EB103A]